MGAKKDRKSALSAWKNFGSKSIFLSILAGLITAGLFSFVLYAFATYGVDQTFPPGNTLNPGCAPGTAHTVR